MSCSEEEAHRRIGMLLKAAEMDNVLGPILNQKKAESTKAIVIKQQEKSVVAKPTLAPVMAKVVDVSPSLTPAPSPSPPPIYFSTTNYQHLVQYCKQFQKLQELQQLQLLQQEKLQQRQPQWIFYSPP